MWSVLNGATDVSWHYSVMQNGRVLAHYPLLANCWHAGDSDPDGGVRANIDLVGVEHEGGGPGDESEPLTKEQLDSTIKLTRWMAEQFGRREFVRYPAQSEGNYWFLVEHNQVSPTACPSGRIPWTKIQQRLRQEMSEIPQEIIEELADHRAKDLLLRELSFGGRYRVVSIHDSGDELVLELRNPDRTALTNPIYIPVRK